MKLDFSKVSTAAAAPQPDAAGYQPVAPYDPLDLDRAKKNMSVHDKKIKEFDRRMRAFKVESDAAAAICTEMVAQASALVKTMEKNRKENIADADNFVRAVNRFVKIYRDQLKAIIEEGNRKIGAWAYLKEQQRREAEAKARQATKKLQADIDKKAKAGGFEPVTMPTIIVPKTNGPIRTESGSASTRMVWTWTVSDPAQVPHKYLMVDAKSVDAAIKAGIREIPGINIFEKPKVTIRTA